MTAKRKRHEVEDGLTRDQSTSESKRIVRGTEQSNGAGGIHGSASRDAGTPINRGRGRPPGSRNKRLDVVGSGVDQKLGQSSPGPKSKAKPLVATPSKAAMKDTPSPRASIVQNADGSTRRKNARLQNRGGFTAINNENDLDGEEALRSSAAEEDQEQIDNQEDIWDELNHREKIKPLTDRLGQGFDQSSPTPEPKGKLLVAAPAKTGVKDAPSNGASHIPTGDRSTPWKSVRFLAQDKVNGINKDNDGDEEDALMKALSDTAEDEEDGDDQQAEGVRGEYNKPRMKSKPSPSGCGEELDQFSPTPGSKGRRLFSTPPRAGLGGRETSSRAFNFLGRSTRRRSVRLRRGEISDIPSDENDPDEEEASTSSDAEEDGEESDLQDEDFEDKTAHKKPKTVPYRLGQQLEQSSPIPRLKGRGSAAAPQEDGKCHGEDNPSSGTSKSLTVDRFTRRKTVRSARGEVNNVLSGMRNLHQEGDSISPLSDEEEDAQEKEDGAEEEGGEDSEDQQGEGAQDRLAGPTPPTPSKRNAKKVPKARRKRSPTPPPDLPPHELYFLQNHTRNAKTSNNTLASLSLLSHEQYHNNMTTYKDPHAYSLKFLHSLHSRSFPQWNFELSQSFNICLYGYGSKRNLITAFANYLHFLHPSHSPKIMIINGYTPALKIRQILTTIATLIFDSPASSLTPKLGTQPRDILDSILAHMTTSPPSSPIHIFVNSLDAPTLRRAPNPSILALLASSPHIRLLVTCDTPSFQRLWEATTREQFNFLFHDTTTFESYAPVEIGSVVDSVNELLDRSGRSVKGKEGVAFVLQSLPENARNLYRVLIAELLAGMDNSIEDDNDDETQGMSHARRGGRSSSVGNKIEVRVLYQKAVEEFICTSEMAFRTLLKEFQDHQMVASKWDGAGMEMLSVPFRREEMEAILDDLVQ